MSFRLEPILSFSERIQGNPESAECQDLIKVMKDYYQVIGFKPPWIGYLVYREETAVGCCGYTGSPTDGRVEVSYGTFKGFEGQGVSSFSCRTLTALALATDPRLTVTAKTAPEVNASVTILKRNGFAYTKVVQDHEIGDAWEWTYEDPTKTPTLEISI